MRTERGLVHKVDGVRARGNVVIGKNHAAGELKIGREAPAAHEIPLQAERVEAYSVGCVRRLKDEEDGYGVEGIFEASAEKTREMRIGENPSIAQAGVECAGVRGSSGNGVSTAGPDFDLVAALLGTGLGDAMRMCGYENCSEKD